MDSDIDPCGAGSYTDIFFKTEHPAPLQPTLHIASIMQQPWCTVVEYLERGGKNVVGVVSTSPPPPPLPLLPPPLSPTHPPHWPHAYARCIDDIAYMNGYMPNICNTEARFGTLEFFAIFRSTARG